MSLLWTTSVVHDSTVYVLKDDDGGGGGGDEKNKKLAVSIEMTIFCSSYWWVLSLRWRTKIDKEAKKGTDKVSHIDL